MNVEIATHGRWMLETPISMVVNDSVVGVVVVEVLGKVD